MTVTWPTQKMNIHLARPACRSAHFGSMWVTCCLLALTFSSPSHATTLRKLTIQGLVSYSDSIIVGQCEKTETVWLEKKIYTIATVRVSQSAKGEDAPGKVIQVYTLGGSVKEPLPVKMLGPGAETMVAGEETLLFLEKFGDKRQFHRVVGMAQGKLPILTDRKTGKKSVGFDRSMKGVKWVDRDGKPVEPGAQGSREEADEGGQPRWLPRSHSQDQSRAGSESEERERRWKVKRPSTASDTDGVDNKRFRFSITAARDIRGSVTSRVVLLFSVVGLLPSVCLGYGNLQFYDAHANVVNSVWVERSYNSATFPDGIPWLLNSQGTTGSTISNVTLSQLSDIVSNAFAAWQAVPQTKIRFTYGGLTANVPSGTETNGLPPSPALDGDNVISFGSPPSGALAITYSFVLNDQYTFTTTNNIFGGTGPSIPPGIYPSGTVLDSDILIANNVDWSVTGERGKYDLQATITHEIGHFIGCTECSRETDDQSEH